MRYDVKSSLVWPATRCQNTGPASQAAEPSLSAGKLFSSYVSTVVSFS